MWECSWNPLLLIATLSWRVIAQKDRHPIEYFSPISAARKVHVFSAQTFVHVFCLSDILQQANGWNPKRIKYGRNE